MLKSPSLIHWTNYSEFKNTEEQKKDKKAAKLLHKLILRKNNVDPKKFLNIPENRLAEKIIIHT